MSKTFSFENKIREKKFNEQVVDTITKMNQYYDFAHEGNHGISFLHHDVFICIFLKYIPRAEVTTLPSISDSLNGLTSSEETFSTGEWFVDSLYKLEKSDYFKILPLIYKKEKKKGWILDIKKIAENSI